jgi:fructose 1,6-bisphosphatase
MIATVYPDCQPVDREQSTMPNLGALLGALAFLFLLHPIARGSRAGLMLPVQPVANCKRRTGLRLDH